MMLGPKRYSFIFLDSTLDSKLDITGTGFSYWVDRAVGPKRERKAK
jgi:hypothetical protein